MNNIWTATILAIVCLVGGFYLSAFFLPLGWIGFLAAIGVVIAYIFGRNRRIQ